MSLQLEDIKKYFEIPDLSVRKTLLYNVTRCFTFFTAKPPTISHAHLQREPTPECWNQIADGLFLGQALGKKGVEQLCNHLKRTERKLKLVVTIQELFEIAGVNLVNKAPTPREWLDRGIDHHLLLMSDFKGDAPNLLILDTIRLIKQHIDKNSSISSL